MIVDVDVFLSRKSEDAPLAKQLYDFLTDKGLKVFDSNHSLEEMGNADYREMIDQALEAATHLIVVGSSVEHITSRQVKYEWNTFHNEKLAGRKVGNLFTVFCGSIVIKDLPVSLRNYQVVPFDPNGFEKKIYSYVKPKNSESTKSVEIQEPKSQPIASVSALAIPAVDEKQLTPAAAEPAKIQKAVSQPVVPAPEPESAKPVVPKPVEAVVEKEKNGNVGEPIIEPTKEKQPTVLPYGEQIRMPKMSNTMTQGVIAKWHKKVGDTIKSGDVLIDIDKTDELTEVSEGWSFLVEDEGTLLYIVEAGSVVAVDDVIAVISQEETKFDVLPNNSAPTPKPAVDKKQVNRSVPPVTKTIEKPVQLNKSASPVSPSVSIESEHPWAEVIRMPKPRMDPWKAIEDDYTRGIRGRDKEHHYEVEWYKKVGEKIKPGDILAQVITDKSTRDFEAYRGKGGPLLYNGAINVKAYKEGTLLYIVESMRVVVDDVIAIIGKEDANFEALMFGDTSTSQPPNPSTTSALKLITPTPTTADKVVVWRERGMVAYESKKYGEAYLWIRKAAEQGDAEAQSTLSKIYGGLLGVSSRDAVKWLLKAAKQGNAEGQYQLGKFYEIGIGGLNKDIEQANYWYQKSSEQGHGLAQISLKMIADENKSWWQKLFG